MSHLDHHQRRVLAEVRAAAGPTTLTVHPLHLVGGMTVSAIPDMAKVVFSHGLTSTFRDGFIPLVTNFRTFKLAAQEVKDAGTALDMVLDSRVIAMQDITDEFRAQYGLRAGPHSPAVALRRGFLDGSLERLPEAVFRAHHYDEHHARLAAHR